MNTSKVKILRIFISSTDKLKHKALYEVIVFAARRYKMAGATVLKGIMGYGATSTIYSIKFWEVMEKVPLVVEIVDEPEKIDLFFQKISPYLEKIKNGCIVTSFTADMVFFKPGKNKKTRQ